MFNNDIVKPNRIIADERLAEAFEQIIQLVCLMLFINRGLLFLLFNSKTTTEDICYINCESYNDLLMINLKLDGSYNETI